MTSDSYLCIMQGVLRLGNTSDASNNINLLRIRNTPNYSNNIESKDFATKRLLSFEHVRDTAELRSTDTRSYNNFVHKSDDASKGSQVFQPEVSTRDVRNNISGPMNCIVFHFHGSYYDQQYVVFLPLTLED